MNIKVHTSLVLAACTVTGLALGSFLVDRYRQIDDGMNEVGLTSVTLRNVELLSERVGQWLTVNDLVLYRDQGYMLATSLNSVPSLRLLIAETAGAPLAAGHREKTDAIRKSVDSLEQVLYETRDHTGPDRAEHLAEIAERARVIGDELLEEVDGFGKALERRSVHWGNDLAEQEQFLTLLAWLAAIVYFGIVWLCWLWTVHKVVVPIESLSEAAGRADHEEREFELPQTGPEEVQQLTQNISSFITKLQDAKAGTEEEVRQRTAELVQANQAKGQFLATMSHELRTPLNGIINMNELMLETTLDQEQSGFARTAKSAAEALLGLINDILDFSKIEARKLELEKVEFDLRTVVDSALEILSGVAESKGLDLHSIVKADVPARVTSDPTRLRQVLINLLNNALKFTTEGSVSAHVCVVTAASGRATLRFEVRDTGIGIPEDRRASLFRAFEQVDSSTTRKYGGTGLGLAICRELVTLMGGEISVDSVAGQGSTFWFTIELDTVVNTTELVDVSDLGVVVVSSRALLAERLIEQLRFLGVAESATTVVGRLGDLDPADRKWLAIIDPYERNGDAFREVQRARASIAIESERVAVLDHWMRHWSADMGSAPRGVVKISDPTTLDSLRSWLVGEAVPIQQEEPAAEVTEPELTASQPIPKLAAASDHVEHGGHGRVLVAEDTDMNQRVVRSILKSGGYEVVVASNGLEAVESFACEAFDLVLMDCQMPIMDGLEATRRIRAIEVERTASSAVPHHVPIVALTANAQEGFDKECLAAGMDRFLSKPCRKQPLLAAIGECLSGKRASADAPKVRAPRVLVADDDAINRKVAQSVLVRAGYELVLVENGRQAVDCVLQEAFDIVLMDCQMPVLDGLEASQCIRDLEETGGLAAGMPQRLPIVALTGNVQDSDREAAGDAGMDEFVTKPFRPKDLLEVVMRFAGPGQKA